MSRRPKKLVKTRRYPHPPEDVWAALTDPRALAEWLMPSTFRAELGARFQFRTDPNWMCSTEATDCEVLALDPPRRMVWSWIDRSSFAKRPLMSGPQIVAWTLTPDGDGTVLRLEQTGAEHMSFFMRTMMSFGWYGMLADKLPKVLKNTKGGVFTPGAVPLNKRYYKANTIPPEFVR